MRPKLLTMAIALALLAAPAQGMLVADACGPCCAKSHDAPCEPGQSPCTFLGAAPCCDAAPAVPVVPALRSLDAPDVQPALTSARVDLSPARWVRRRGNGGEPASRTSPLRLSVVLQI